MQEHAISTGGFKEAGIDVLSALVGDIGRRGEEPKPRVVKREDGSLLIDGRMPLLDAMAALSISVESDRLEDELPDVRTMAGLVLSLLGQIPKEGEYVAWRGWRLEVVDMDGSRIDQILAAKVESK